MVTAEIPAALARLGDVGTIQAYLCGPPPMIDAGLTELVRAGVPFDAMFHDKFTDASAGAK
jgi:p-cymene methyl-monooxygenase electron transfer component